MPSIKTDAKNRVPTGVLFLILWVGWALIVHAGVQNKRFHPDEALYTTFARNAFVHGDWALVSPLDKPPLSIYANAVAQALFGGIITDAGVYDLPIRTGEFVARLPNMFAGVIVLALFIAIARRHKNALLAPILLLITPFFYAFSASAFTDMLMLMWVMGAWLASERGQVRLSGVMLGLAFATKPQAILWLPILIWRGLWGKSLYRWLWFFACFGMVLAVLLWWDTSRGTTSVFALGHYNYPTQSLLAHPTEWLDRAWLWLGYVVWGMNPITVAMLGLTSPLNLLSKPKGTDMIYHVPTTTHPKTGFLFLLQHRERGRADEAQKTFLIRYTIGYSALHIVLGIPLYDRYALLILPPMLLGIALLVGDKVKTRGMMLLACAGLGVVLLTNGTLGRDGYPLDSDGHIIMMADAVNDLPFGAIVYDHWRGWELGYYLGAWSDKRRVYYPNPQVQAIDSLNNPETAPRFLVAPTDADYESWLSAMREVGYETYLYCELSSYIIFALIPPTNKDAIHQTVCHSLG